LARYDIFDGSGIIQSGPVVCCGRTLRHTGRQLPGSLPARWKEDLPQLIPFNRKLLWVQSGFTVLTIVAFGTLTLTLHAELLRGDHAAMGLATFIGMYWTVRVLVDAFYFSHADWPQGRQFAIGHTLLTTLFCFLAASYLSLFVWNTWMRGSCC
jgi:hypothetical protein